jgi:hypothetical protein
MQPLRRAVRSCGLAALLLGLMLPLDSTAAGPREEIQNAVRSGMPIVLVVASAQRPDPTDEARGDWAAYLNGFNSHADPAIKIIKITATLYRSILAVPALKTEFATLFIRDREHALQYDGMILEPQIYSLGQNYLLGRGDLAPRSGYGLRPTTVQLR